MKVLINSFCIFNMLVLNSLNLQSCNGCYLSKLSCFEIKNGELKGISFAVSDVGVVEIYEKSCKQTNGLLKMKGYTVSAISPAKHSDLEDYIGGFEPSVLIVGVTKEKNQFVIKDTLSISDERGYFETQFKRNKYFYIGIIQRCNKKLFAYRIKRAMYQKSW